MTSISYLYNEDSISEVIRENAPPFQDPKGFDKLLSLAVDSIDKFPYSHLFSTTVLQRIATVPQFPLFTPSTTQKIQNMTLPDPPTRPKPWIRSWLRP